MVTVSQTELLRRLWSATIWIQTRFLGRDRNPNWKSNLCSQVSQVRLGGGGAGRFLQGLYGALIPLPFIPLSLPHSTLFTASLSDSGPISGRPHRLPGNSHQVAFTLNPKYRVQQWRHGLSQQNNVDLNNQSVGYFLVFMTVLFPVSTDEEEDKPSTFKPF